MKRILFTLLILQLYCIAFGQTDTTFWFAAPDNDVVNNPTYGQYDRPIYLRISTYSSVANVTISIPANSGFIPITLSIPANSTSSINLTPSINLIENFNANTIENKGILIVSSANISVYYEVNSSSCQCNPELFSLKGKNALGIDFIIPSQTTWSLDTIRHPDPRAAFDIVATENNTSITITPSKPLVGRPANIPFTINLNRGQTFSCQGLYKNESNLLNGSKVVSDKPISVTSKEDLSFADGPCADLAGDQLIPSSVMGKEFAIVRGNLTPRDKVIISAIQNNTNIYFDGSSTPITTINVGQSFEYDITSTLSLYIVADKTVNVLHYTGTGCELGSAVIPKLDCTGSNSVALVRSNPGNAILLLVTKNGNQGNFLVNGASGIISASDFSVLTGTGGAYVYSKKDISASMPLNVATRITNSSGTFQLGFINSYSGGSMYGYFSNFKTSNTSFSQTEVCKTDSIQLTAFGGISYQWSPSIGLNNPNISTPKASPPATTNYKVLINTIDGCIDSAFVKVIVNNCNPPIVINDYTPVLALYPCKNILTVENAGAFNVGDTLLMIQMKGAVIDSSNTAAFGSITDYKSAGNYEFNYIKSKSGNSIELLNTISRTYEIPAGKVQLVRVPYYSDVTFNSVLTCLPWDGSKGGIVAFNSSGTVTLNADVDVSQKGFTGGLYEQLPSACDATDYFYPQSSTSAALKGEGIVSLSNNMIRGRGKAANGGGSGNDHNSGGAGGSNAGAGGNGGKEFGSGFCAGIANGGIGGSPLNYSNASNKIFLGGGGGAGDINGVFGGFKGGNGGGIVIINANLIAGNNNNIKSLGEDAADCTTNDCWESGSGGGAGGTVLINSNSIVTNITVNTSGGKGGSLSNTNANGYSAPGGGGGGGLLWVNSNALSPAIIYTSNGGTNGLFTELNETGGATNGSNGNSMTNLIVPVTIVPFKPNIDSVRFKDSIFNCSSFDFKGQAYINTNPINSWQWNFGNGATASSQNTSYSYSTDGTFPVKLIITDINGCKDSTTKNVIVQSLTVDAGNDTTICKNTAYQLNTSVLNGISFTWTPVQYLNNNTIQNPIATINSSQKFYFTANNSIGCIATDSVTLAVYPDPQFNISPDQSICKNETAQLIATGGNTYQWKNESSLSALNIPNPSASPATTTTYAVKVTDQCNISDSLFTTITVNDLPVIGLTKSNDIDCSNDKAMLSATGATEYIWSPVTGLDNPSSPNPVSSPTTTTEYTVRGTDANGCSAEGKITVEVTTNNKSGYNIPNAFTPNGDGKNDCIRVKYWGPTLEFEFNIYTRWGEKVFTSKNTDSCWDGTYKGVQQPLGVYVYYIKAKTACGDVFKKGTITLIR